MTTTDDNPAMKKATSMLSHPSANINEGSEEYVVYVDVPGIQREDIKVNVKENRELTIAASKKEALHCFTNTSKQDFFRWTESFTLPADADAVTITAIYRNGELQLHIPKRKSPAIINESITIFVY